MLNVLYDKIKRKYIITTSDRKQLMEFLKDLFDDVIIEKMYIIKAKNLKNPEEFIKKVEFSDKILEDYKKRTKLLEKIKNTELIFKKSEIPGVYYISSTNLKENFILKIWKFLAAIFILAFIFIVIPIINDYIQNAFLKAVAAIFAFFGPLFFALYIARLIDLYTFSFEDYMKFLKTKANEFNENKNENFCFYVTISKKVIYGGKHRKENYYYVIAVKTEKSKVLEIFNRLKDKADFYVPNLRYRNVFDYEFRLNSCMYITSNEKISEILQKDAFGDIYILIIPKKKFFIFDRYVSDAEMFKKIIEELKEIQN